MMRFPGNCALATAAAFVIGNRPRTMVNRSGRRHFYWVDASGCAWEFYTKGASRRSYLRNSLTLGSIQRCPALDERLEEPC